MTRGSRSASREYQDRPRGFFNVSCVARAPVGGHASPSKVANVEFPAKILTLIPQELIKIPHEPPWASSHGLQPRSCSMARLPVLLSVPFIRRICCFRNTYFNSTSTELNSTFTVSVHLTCTLRYIPWMWNLIRHLMTHA